jgi:tetratricopeptide (TPR) repeat protein
MEQAIDYFQRALVIAREVDEKSAISAALNNLSSAFGVLKDSVKETSYLREAIEINKEIGQWYFLSINYLNRGLIFKKAAMYDSAMFYYQMAADLAEALEDNELLLDIKCYMGRVQYSLEDLENLRLIASEVFEKSELFGLKKKQYCAAQMLELVYRRNNDFEEAYKYAKIASSINDSLRLVNNDNELERLELQSDLARHEQELSMQGARRNYIYIIAGIVLISLLGFVSSLFLRHRLRAQIHYLERNKFKSELEFKNKEFTIQAMSLMKKNELLRDLSQEIMEIEKDVSDDKAKSALKRVSSELIKVIETQIAEEFELRFKEIHSDFYQNLIKISPDITPNEQKLCAFLRLHMTTKEISILTGQSIKSIEQARYRLRKKLNISGTDANLIRYLSKL